MSVAGRTAAFVAIQALAVGVALPGLSAFGLRGRPPELVPRWSHVAPAVADLGFPWSAEAVAPAARLADGLGDLHALGFSLALVVLFLGCITIGALVVRSGWERRQELAVRTVVGARRRNLRREIFLHHARPLLAGSAIGLALGLGLETWLRAQAPPALVPPAMPLSSLSAVAFLAPAAAVLAAASLEAGGALRRMREPLSYDPVARLARLGLGAIHLGAVAAALTVGMLLLRGAKGEGGETTAWAEARDTLVIEARVTDRAKLETGLAALNGRAAAGSPSEPSWVSRSPDAWYVSSPGVFSNLGMVDRGPAECDCALGTIIAPVIPLTAQRHSLSPGTFGAMGIPVVRGREFVPSDRPGARPVAVIDGVTSRLFRGVDPIGKEMRIGTSESGEWYEIVGIVDPPPADGLAARAGRPLGNVYLSALQHPPDAVELLVPGGAADPGARLTTLADRAPEFAPLGTRTLADVRSALGEPLAWFALVSAVLALAGWITGACGLWTGIAQETRARSGEIGVHRAVGARSADIARLVLGDAVRIVFWGSALALIFAPALVRGLSHRFPWLSGFDLASALVVLAILSAPVLTAATLGVRRACRLAPIEAIGIPE